MQKTEIKDKDRNTLEKSNIPFCIYKYSAGKIIAILASKGFADIFNISSAEAVDFLNNDRYRYYVSEDKKGGGEAFYHFEVTGGIYVHDFKVLINNFKDTIEIYSRGFHIFTNDGTRLLIIFYYTDPEIIKILKAEELKLSEYENILVDITDNFISFSKIRDEKTGLLSMQYFLELSKHYSDLEIEKGNNPVFVAFDFINMRAFNEKYSFNEGNRLLTKFGNILRGEFGDYECARFSADHFYVCTYEKDIEKRVLRVFEELRSANDGKTLSTRCGIYINRSGKRIESNTASDRAKIACDYAKNAVESVYTFFDDEMLNTLENESYVINNLDKAMEEKWIQVYYQPIYRGITGKVCDVEALARWIDPVKGMMTPYEFIPVLENAKLLYKLDLYMLDSILNDFKIREEKGLSLVPVSINISRYDFESCDMVEEIRKRIEKSGYSFDLITVEITESVVGAEPEFLKEQIARFHQIGIKVWMDDFGSGYSTLNILSDFDFDLIKLDMKFIRRFKENPKVAITIRNLVHMAEDLGIDFLCEGVESQDEASFLINTGCDKLQGYYYSRPNPLDIIFDDMAVLNQELHGEASYYEDISMTSLHNPRANGDEESYVTKTIGSNIGILEYVDGNYYYLRGNTNHREFLTNFDCFVDEDKKMLDFSFNQNFHKILNQVVLRAINTKDWEYFQYENKDGFTTSFYVKRISKNKVTGGYAIMIIIVSSNVRNQIHNDRFIPEFSIPFAVFKVILNDEGDKVIDTEFIYANDVYCRSIKKQLRQIIGKSFLKVAPDASESWFPYCYEAAVLGKTVRGSLYSPETKQYLGFVVSPTNDPLCCSFAFMNVDKETSEAKYLLSRSVTEEALINITNALALEKDNNISFENALLEIKKIFYPDFSFIIQDNDNCKNIIINSTTDFKENDNELLRNEYLALIKNLSDKCDDEGFIIYKSEEGQNVFHGTHKIVINNLAIAPIKNYDSTIIGYVGLINYKSDDQIDVKEILKQVALYSSSRLIENMMVEKLQHQSEYDALTNVLNRKGFTRIAKEYLEKNPSQHAVYLIMDIDDFKFINDLNGHHVGDETLKHFARLVESHFGTNSVIGRSGGDEFQVLLPNTTLAQAVPIIDKFAYLEKKLVVDSKEIKYEISIGYSEYPTQASNLLKLLTSADAALYYTKTTQGSQANLYKPQMNMASRSQLGFGLKDIAGNMPAAMLIYEALGDEKILYVNNELVKMFECDSTEEFLEFVHGSFMGMLHPDDLDEIEASIWKQINESQGDVDNDFVDYRIITKKGNIKRVIDNGRLVDSKFYGKVFYVILIEEEPHIEFQERAKATNK